MKIYRQALAAALAAVFLLAGCTQEAEPALADNGVSIREAVLTADPQAAIDDVYETLPDARVDDLDLLRFRDLFPELEEVVESYYGKVSDATGGLADMIILKPVDDATATRDTIRDALRRYQDRRIQEFENYDILDSFSIATEAEVYSQGDYLILLMLPDLEAAREIVDQYIPL